ncbi:MAG: MFS transporter, partial [Burkholderiaceae bacterium]
YGARRVLMLGGLLYALGLAGMAFAESGSMLHLSGGVLIGVAVGGTAFGIIFSALGKIVPEKNRAMAFGVGVAAGSFGQFLFSPVIGRLIDGLGWHTALLVLSAIAALIIPFAFGVKGDSPDPTKSVTFNPAQALRGAIRDRSFHLLFWGYFVCGLQVVFIGLHLPVYLQDNGFSGNVGAMALALIGLFNIVGSLLSGYFGQTLSKKWMLVAIYLARSAVMAAFVLVPVSEYSIYLFSATMGLLWLSTVPLTSSLVGQVWGVKYLGMLGGVIFLGHQLGSFVGAWMGGRLYDQTGSYDIAWMVVIAFGLFAAVMHAPIDQRPLAERKPALAS